MSSSCGKSDYRDADAHFENPVSSPTKCSDGSKFRPSFAGSEDAPESDGEETGYIHQTVNDVYEDKGTGKYVSDCLSLKSSNEEDKNYAAALQQIFSETTPMVLIPAIKGSREKHGLLLPRKLSVSWAEEVYDPPPSIVSHTRGKKQHQQKPKSKDNHKRNSKKVQKGSSNSSSRGGGGKDKKQSSHKHSSRGKFQMGNTDAYCGGRFLKTNPTKVHYSVAAEAL